MSFWSGFILPVGDSACCSSSGKFHLKLLLNMLLRSKIVHKLVTKAFLTRKKVDVNTFWIFCSIYSPLYLQDFEEIWRDERNIFCVLQKAKPKLPFKLYVVYFQLIDLLYSYLHLLSNFPITDCDSWLSRNLHG